MLAGKLRIIVQIEVVRAEVPAVQVQRRVRRPSTLARPPPKPYSFHGAIISFASSFSFFTNTGVLLSARLAL